MLLQHRKCAKKMNEVIRKYQPGTFKEHSDQWMGLIQHRKLVLLTSGHTGLASEQ